MNSKPAESVDAADLAVMADHVQAHLGDAVSEVKVVHGQLQIVTDKDHILEVLRFLRDDANCRFVCFTDICGVDWPEREKRFEVVYHLLSPYRNARVRIKVPVAEGESVPSCIEIFPGADWYEREVWDMYGVFFSGHPDLRRILTDYGFQGHPLRKDFPVTGFVEVRYDEDKKRVVYEPVNLQQAWRAFDNLSPWRGEPWQPRQEEVLPGDEKAQGQGDQGAEAPGKDA
ncbi:NADH-quinone oxidoreductase subunit C [Thermopetrobacter sp. TC1]|uniref:NADH-quinone oxidoreductase subunit C n=1 Tax=Thermopetrobacter sp. TC1 TaxID=1495045 RepID=UPI000AF8684A|nr:NADH-quinone oxidoreductase subunit C [Thermopetrobacter sp. TC1]